MRLLVHTALFVVTLTLSSAGGRGRGRIFDPKTFDTIDDQPDDDGERDKRLLNIFQVVRFPNSACNTTAGDQGVCYTAAECTSRSGSNSGSCASGFGVCCSFSIGCGGMTSQNNTYFVSSSEDTSPCSVTICPCDASICQIRLDFQMFDIAQPTSVPTDAVIAGATMAVTKTQCQAATFVAGSTGTNVPIICGTNTGQHMILEADEFCNPLTFAWTNANPRNWRIKTSQISCNDPNKPNEGCLQWYTGTTGSVQSFNFDGGIHLANQDQLICVRREQGSCQITWTAAANMFKISGDPALNMAMNNLGTFCTRDYLVIPSGFMLANQPTIERYCGINLYNNMDSVNNLMSIAAGPVSSQMTPFNIRFISNALETNVMGAAMADDAESDGFKLTYTQQACVAFPT